MGRFFIPPSTNSQCIRAYRMSQSNQLPLTEINPKYFWRVLQETMNRYRIEFTAALSDGCHPPPTKSIVNIIAKVLTIGCKRFPLQYLPI